MEQKLKVTKTQTELTKYKSPCTNFFFVTGGVTHLLDPEML